MLAGTRRSCRALTTIRNAVSLRLARRGAAVGIDVVEEGIPARENGLALAARAGGWRSESLFQPLAFLRGLDQIVGEEVVLGDESRLVGLKATNLLSESFVLALEVGFVVALSGLD